MSTHHHSPHAALASAGLLFGAVCWGIIWYPYRILEQHGISGTAASIYAYSLCIVAGLVLFRKHYRGALQQPINFILLGLAVGWANLSYVLAIIDGQVMRVMLLFYLSPLWTVLLAKFFLHEHLDLKRMFIIFIALAGAVVMLWQPNAWPLPENRAEWLGLSSGMAFAVSNVITRHSTVLSLPAKSMSVWLGVLIVALVFTPYLSLHLPMPQEISLHDWGMLIIVTLMLLLATIFVQYGVTHLMATQATVLFMFELVVAAIASSLLTDEVMSMREWLGGAMVVSASLYAAWMNSV